MEKKCSILLVFLLIFAGSVGCALAAAPFTDDFDGYEAGDLAGHGNWIYGTVKNDFYNSDPNSATADENSGWYLYGQSSVGKNSGEWYFKFWYQSNGGSNIIDLKLNCNNALECISSAGSSEIVIVANGDVEIPSGILGNIPPEEWHTIGYKWSAGSISYNLDGGAWSDGWEMPGEYLNGFFTYSNWHSNFRIDDLTESAPIIAGADVSISPWNPIDGEVNIVADITNFPANGEIVNPTANLNTWDELCLTFQDAAAKFNLQYKCIDFSIIPGGIYDYDFDVDTIENDAAYILRYILIGHDPAGNVVSFNYDPINTFVTHETPIPAAAYTPTTPDQWTLPEPEDCSIYESDPAPKILCNIKNFLQGIFIPSQTTLNGLQSTFSQFTGKFPFNYVSAVLDSINSIKQGINESQGINFNIFGNSGTVDFTFWTNTGLASLIHTVVTFILIIGFAFWGVNYLNRIF